MNPFYDISEQLELPANRLQLRNLGAEKVFASIGKRTRDGWGGPSTINFSHHTTPIKSEDYDSEFVGKLLKCRPAYTMDKVLDHHCNYYCLVKGKPLAEFLMHMRYAALVELKKRANNEVYITLFEEWLKEKTTEKEKKLIPHTVNNNTINVGTVNAPIQFQQNSDHSVQTQHNKIQKEQFHDFITVLQKDIDQIDENIRKDFAIEMDYAVALLEKEKDIQPQLLNIGDLIKDVGLGTFANLLAAPIYEFIKSFLGLN
jgi:hypothetical protein